MIKIIKDNIATMDVDCIVNAANKFTLPSAGVDGSIRLRAGFMYTFATIKLFGCEPGQVKITNGYRLKADNVIHAVAPVYKDGNKNTRQLLYDCYKNSLEEGSRLGAKSIAFPCLGAGYCRFPFDLACRIAITAIKHYFHNANDITIEKVYLVTYSEKDFNKYNEILNLDHIDKVL